MARDLEVLGKLNLTSFTGDIQVPTAGIDIQRSSGDISYYLDVGGAVRSLIFNASTYFWTPTGAYYLNAGM